MILKILIIFSLFGFSDVKGEKINRAALKKSILDGCVSMMKSVADKKQLVCDCIVTNFDMKASDYQLKLLAENYKGKVKDGAEKEGDSSAVENFDYEVATACLENPNWRIKDK